MTYSDRTAATAAAPAPRYKTATTPLGTWSAATKVTTNSCGGQPAFVRDPTSSAPRTCTRSDLWNNGNGNEALANYYWAPLSFAGSGAVNPFNCAATVSVGLDVGSPGPVLYPVGLDESSGLNGFQTWCDIGRGWQRLQTIVAGRTAAMTSASVTTFQSGYPNAGLTIEIYRLDSSSRVTDPPLYATTVPATSIGWSPRNLTVTPGIQVTAGTGYGIVARSSATTGCYGFAYSDTAPYRNGIEAYSGNGGSTYTNEPNRSLKFQTINQFPAPTGT